MTEDQRFVGYYRVSTVRQGRSGLGLEAQREAVKQFVAGRTQLAEYTEVESGTRSDRPELAKAIKRCRLTGATLVIARLDRLSRNAAFLLALRDSEVKFACCDIPEANDLTIGILALLAEHERKLISERTKAALAHAKRRGVKLGNPRGAEPLRRADKGNADAIAAFRRNADRRAEMLRETVDELRSSGVTTLLSLARALNDRSIHTPRRRIWYATSVKLLLARLDALRNGATK